jgi:hypothetical protein
MTKSKKMVIGLILLIIVLTGCSSSRDLSGKWEGYNTKENIEFIDSKTLNWNGSVCDFEVKDERLFVDYGFFQMVFGYSIKDGKLLLSREDDEDDSLVFIKEGYLENDKSAYEELFGEWGIQYDPMFTFKEDGSVNIKELPETKLADSGHYSARNGIIRYESDSDLNHSIFLEYEFDDKKLALNYIDEASVELIRVDTDEIRAKASEDYLNRYNSGLLYQYEMDSLSDDECKKYIYDNVIRYSSRKMDEPDTTNSAVDIHISAKNMSSRSIKYIYYTVMFTNNVGDEIDNSLFGNRLSFTGPVEPGQIGGRDSYWPSVIFDSKGQIKEWMITEIEIEYSDGDTIIIEGDDVQNNDSFDAVGQKSDENAESINVANADLFDLSFDEIINLYGNEFESYDYAGSTIIDYHEVGYDISIGFSAVSFSPSNKPSVIYTQDLIDFADSHGIDVELTPSSLFNAFGEPISEGYDEMGEEGYIVEYNLEDIAYRFICDDETLAVKYIELTKVSFMGIEDYLTKTYDEFIEQYGEDCQVDKKDNGLFILNLTETEEDIKLYFADPTSNSKINPLGIVFTPSDSKSYNGINDGMMPEEIESVLGLPVSNDYDERLGNVLMYDYEKFSVDFYCDESFGLYFIRMH